MARAMWTGAISFGMVSIPIQLFKATEDGAGVSFNQLCPTCLVRIKQKTVCPSCETEVGRGELKKGYDTGQGFVVFESADEEALPVASRGSIEIDCFVDPAEIDDQVMVEAAYFVAPQSVKGVRNPAFERAFVLLRDSLRDSGKVAIGKICLRAREQMVRLTARGDGMLMNSLRWPDELRSDADIPLPGAEVVAKDAELGMARMLIESLTKPFDPSLFTDTYAAAVRAMAEQKMPGAAPATVATTTTAGDGQVVDLMEALRRSVESVGSGAKRARTGAGPGAAEGEAVATVAS